MRIPSQQKTIANHYVFSIVVTLLTLLLSGIMWDLIAGSPFIFFFGAVAISAWYGGLGAGVVSAGLSIALADYFLIEPLYTFFASLEDFLQLVMFSLVAFLISWTEDHRRQSEYLLRQARDQLHIILNGISEGVTAQDAEGRVIFANETAAQLTGYPSADAMINQPASALHRRYSMFDTMGEPLPFSKLPRFMVFRTGKSAAVTFKLQFVDDLTERWIELKSSPVLDAKRNVVLAVNIFRDVTDAVEMEQERTQYQAIVHHSGDAIISKRLDGTISSWNAGAKHMYGYAPDEIIGQHISITFPPEIKTRELQLTERIRNGEKIENYDTVRVRKDGRRIHISKTISPIRDHRGEIVGYASIERDITERVLLEKKQQETEKHLRKVLDTLPILVGVMKPDGTLIEANRAALSVANLSPQDVLDKPFPETYWWAYSTEIQAQLEDAIERAKQGETVRYDVPVRIDNDKYMTIDFMLSPMFDDDGNLSHLIPSALDITERILREGEILRLTIQADAQRRRFRNIIANVPGVVFEGSGELGQPQHVDFISDYAETMLGYTPEERESMPDFWGSVIHPDDVEWALEQTKVIYEQHGGTGTVQFRSLTKEGQAIHTEAHSTIIVDEKANSYYVCGVLMDITARKRMEDALVQYTDDLKRSNEELEQFAYVASHDLQEPLRMVTSYLQLIEKRYQPMLDDDGREFIQFAVDGASRMKKLIADLLTYSRVQRSTVKHEPVDMNAVMEQVKRNLQHMIDEANAIVEVENLPTITGNEGQMVQLMQNLIGNGIKFQRPGHQAVVQINCEQRGNDFVFTVKDNGIGIDPQYIDRIFIIFQRLHSRDEYSGTGIGLAISKKIIEKHGGEIWLESTPDEGSTFYFSVPSRRSRRMALNGSNRNSVS